MFPTTQGEHFGLQPDQLHPQQVCEQSSLGTLHTEGVRSACQPVHAGEAAGDAEKSGLGA